MLEGDEQDRELSKDYFDAHKIRFDHLVLSSEVIPFLQHSPQLPAIILLTMNSLPDNGLSVLKKIKANEHFKHIPVIILGEDTQPELIKDCYVAGASTFFNKPFSFKLTDDTIKTFIHYWFEVAQLPDHKTVYSDFK